VTPLAITGQQVLTVISAIGVPTLVTVIFNFFNNRQTLKRNAPKTDAEVDEINTRVATQVITNLRTEVTRLSDKADAAVKTADAAEAKAEEREAEMRKALAAQRREFESLIEDMQIAHKRETDELRRQIKILQDHLADVESHNPRANPNT
jgi:Holliday junction resolvasome RuvABC DNA-binding subunit